MRVFHLSGGPLDGERTEADSRDSMSGPLRCPTLDPDGEYVASFVDGQAHHFEWKQVA